MATDAEALDVSRDPNAEAHAGAPETTAATPGHHPPGNQISSSTSSNYSTYEGSDGPRPNAQPGSAERVAAAWGAADRSAPDRGGADDLDGSQFADGTASAPELDPAGDAFSDADPDFTMHPDTGSDDDGAAFGDSLFVPAAPDVDDDEYLPPPTH